MKATQFVLPIETRERGLNSSVACKFCFGKILNNFSLALSTREIPTMLAPNRCPVYRVVSGMDNLFILIKI